MLHLNIQGLKDRSAWEAAGIALPRYDVEAMKARTLQRPSWVHFGAGNIFRGFLAAAQQTLLNAGVTDTGILAAESFDFQIIDKVYEPYDELSLLVRMHADGSYDKEVVASVAGGYKADCAGPDWARLVQVFQDPSLQLASFTITEKGYALTDLAGETLPVARQDFAAGPGRPAAHHVHCGGAPLPPLPGGGTPHRHGEHGQLRAERKKAPGGRVCRRRGMGAGGTGPRRLPGMALRREKGHLPLVYDR